MRRILCNIRQHSVLAMIIMIPILTILFSVGYIYCTQWRPVHWLVFRPPPERVIAAFEDHSLFPSKQLFEVENRDPLIIGGKRVAPALLDRLQAGDLKHALYAAHYLATIEYQPAFDYFLAKGLDETIAEYLRVEYLAFSKFVDSEAYIKHLTEHDHGVDPSILEKVEQYPRPERRPLWRALLGTE